MSGAEIKAFIYENGLKLWQVADKIGMQDSNFSRRLRKPFSEQEVIKIKNAVAELKANV